MIKNKKIGLGILMFFIVLAIVPIIYAVTGCCLNPYNSDYMCAQLDEDYLISKETCCPSEGGEYAVTGEGNEYAPESYTQCRNSPYFKDNVACVNQNYKDLNNNQ
jgi:hypothetical protein